MKFVLAVGLAFMASAPLALPMDNGFCIENAAEFQGLFVVDAGEFGRWSAELAPQGQLCTLPSPTPISGFVSVFTSEDAVEGCSRLAKSGSVQILLDYQDFDRCQWQTRP